MSASIKFERRGRFDPHQRLHKRVARSAVSAARSTRVIPSCSRLSPIPVGAGFVDGLARPGGNATGFTTFEYGIGAKWLELLKQIAPGATRSAVFHHLGRHRTVRRDQSRGIIGDIP